MKPANEAHMSKQLSAAADDGVVAAQRRLGDALEVRRGAQQPFEADWME